MNDRLRGYLRAIETGTTERYHDYRNIFKGKMSKTEYNQKYHCNYHIRKKKEIKDKNGSK